MGILSTIAAVFGFSCARHEIHVEFINEKDNTSVGIVDLPLERLPDTFAINTTFDIGDKKWSVTKADPVTKTAFAKTRRLRVFLVPVTAVPASGILFSLPTISDDLGVGEGSTPPDDTVFQIHEDDWRQIEFVAQVYKQEIASEFDDIRKIYSDRKPKGGFTRVHIRKRIPSPLGNKAISLTDLRQALPPKHQYKAVGVQRSLGTFQKSFAWDVDEGVTLWGTTTDGDRIRIFCISVRARHPHSPDVTTALARFCSERNLYLIDWCRASKALTTEEIRALVDQ